MPNLAMLAQLNPAMMRRRNTMGGGLGSMNANPFDAFGGTYAPAGTGGGFGDTAGRSYYQSPTVNPYMPAPGQTSQNPGATAGGSNPALSGAGWAPGSTGNAGWEAAATATAAPWDFSGASGSINDQRGYVMGPNGKMVPKVSVYGTPYGGGLGTAINRARLHAAGGGMGENGPLPTGLEAARAAAAGQITTANPNAINPTPVRGANPFGAPMARPTTPAAPGMYWGIGPDGQPMQMPIPGLGR